MSTTDSYADLQRRVEDLENQRKPQLRSGRGNVWGDNFGLNDALNMPRAAVLLGANQAFAASAVNTVIWNSQIATYDTDGMWSNAANTRLTVRTAGLYLVAAQLEWDAVGAVAASTMRAFIYKSGVQVAIEGVPPVMQALVPTIMRIAWPVPANAGDYFEILGQQSCVANLNLIAGSGISMFSATLLSTT